MIKKYIYIIFVLTILSCQSLDKPPKPEVIIEEDKMVEILTDIAFIKAAKTTYRKVLEVQKINPEAYILKKHNIDSAIFAQNNVWYSGQLEKYQEIFTRVKANLDASKIKYEKLKKEEDSIKKVKDSVKKVKDSIKKVKDTLKISEEKLIKL